MVSNEYKWVIWVNGSPVNIVLVQTQIPDNLVQRRYVVTPKTDIMVYYISPVQ